MAKYGKAAGKSVKSAMHREKRGTLKSGKGGKGGRVTSRKQAIAIGLSEARKKGAKVPRKKKKYHAKESTRKGAPANPWNDGYKYEGELRGSGGGFSRLIAIGIHDQA